jgi:hypothetical protein
MHASVAPCLRSHSQRTTPFEATTRAFARIARHVFKEVQDKDWEGHTALVVLYAVASRCRAWGGEGGREQLLMQCQTPVLVLKESISTLTMLTHALTPSLHT